MGRFATVAERRSSSAARRSKLFTRLAKEVETAARFHPDPEANPRLRQAIQKAKQANMPGSNIERALAKASGELAAEQIFELLYEARGSAQETYLLEIQTDNKNRARSEIRQLLQKTGVQLLSPGSVSWAYEKVGLVTLRSPQKALLEELLLEAIESSQVRDYEWSPKPQEIFLCLYLEPERLDLATDFFWKQEGITVESTELIFRCQEKVDLSETAYAAHQERLEKLQDHEEIHSIFHNVRFRKDQ